MSEEQLKRVVELSDADYQTLANYGSVTVGGVTITFSPKTDMYVTEDTTLEQAKAYTDEQITKTIAGGTKLYRHSITCYIENAYTGDILAIEDNNIITTNPTKYENINDAMNDAIRCGAKFVRGDSGLIFLAKGWYAVHDGQVINDGLIYDVLSFSGVQQVVVAEWGDPWTISVFFTDSKVEGV